MITYTYTVPPPPQFINDNNTLKFDNNNNDLSNSNNNDDLATNNNFVINHRIPANNVNINAQNNPLPVHNNSSIINTSHQRPSMYFLY